MIPAPSSNFTLQPFNEPYSSCLCVNGRKTFKWILSASVLGLFSTIYKKKRCETPKLKCFLSVSAGHVNVMVSAQAEPSHARCGTEVVTVPERGRVDVVTQSLLVLVSVNQLSGV